MSKIDIMKILLDYNAFMKECVSLGTEIDKNTIRDYLKGNYFYTPIHMKKENRCINHEIDNENLGFCPSCDTDYLNQ